jgi:hypothetical protein
LESGFELPVLLPPPLEAPVPLEAPAPVGLPVTLPAPVTPALSRGVNPQLPDTKAAAMARLCAVSRRMGTSEGCEGNEEEGVLRSVYVYEISPHTLKKLLKKSESVSGCMWME